MSALDLARLPARSARTVALLEKSGYVIEGRLHGRVRQLVSPGRPSAPYVFVDQSVLEASGLTGVPPFAAYRLADRRVGRTSFIRPRIYLRALPPYDFDSRPTVLDELLVMLLVRDSGAARALVAAHPKHRWSYARGRIHREGLYARARYFGLHKRIGLRPPRGGNTQVRRDAYRRAKTEPIRRRT